jgi:hypothetical protein
METNRDILPAPGPRQIESADLVRANLATVLSQLPDLVSYDPTTDEGEMVSLKCAVDPGCPATEKNNWTGTVVHWGIAPWEGADPKTGELSTVPSILLVADDGRSCRPTGWPAIKAFAAILRHMGKERCQLGVQVRVVRRASSIPGRSYWSIIPDI